MGREPSCAGDERGVLWDPPVGVAQRSVRLELVCGFEHRGSAAAEEIGSTRAFGLREAIQAVDEVVVELDEDFAAGHEAYGTPYASWRRPGRRSQCP